MMYGRVGALLVVMMVMVAGLLTSCTAESVDYTDEGLYPWPPRGARASPSMRLRFGKRGDTVWGLTQRSMPSLRMRFGKRTWTPDEIGLLTGAEAGLERVEGQDDGDVAEGYEESEMRGRRGGRDDAPPGLRLRFGKRDVGEVMEASATARQL